VSFALGCHSTEIRFNIYIKLLKIKSIHLKKASNLREKKM